jgi:hypothetical protein
MKLSKVDHVQQFLGHIDPFGPSRSSACRATHTDKLTVRPAWLMLMARVMARVLISDDDGDLTPNSYVLQRLSQMKGVERVTGIEPALSAWELFELMGSVLGSLRVSWP